MNLDLSDAKAHYCTQTKLLLRKKVKVKVKVGLLYLQEHPDRTVENWIQHVLHGFMYNTQFGLFS